MAQSEPFGINSLKEPGNSFSVEDNRSKWDDGVEYFDTQGCQDVENQFVALNGKSATLVTRYTPPAPIASDG